MKRMRRLAVLAAALLMIFAAAAVVRADSYIDQNMSLTTTNSATVVWQDVAQRLVATYGYQSGKVDSYQLVWGTSSSELTGSAVVGPTSTSYTITGLLPGTRYYVAVKWTGSLTSTRGYTYTRTNEQAYSMYVYTTPGQVTKFGNYFYLSSHKGLQALFTLPDGNKAVNGYEYEIVNTSGKVLAKGTTTSAQVYLSSFSGYKKVARLRVRGYIKFSDSTEVICGAWSPWKNLVPQPILSTNTKKYGIKSDGTLKLAWTKVAGASKYIVYVSEKPESGYKKVATVSQKSKKTITMTLKKFKGKKFQQLKSYYVRIITMTKKYGKSGKPYYTRYWTYRVYR